MPKKNRYSFTLTQVFNAELYGLTKEAINKQISKHLADIKTLKLVSKITFDISQIIDTNKTKDFCSILQNLTALFHLHVNFSSWTTITTKDLKILSLSLSRLILLSTLHLDFSGCKITDQQLNTLSLALNHLPRLTTLDLRFESCMFITDHSLQNHFNSLKRLKSLSSLTLIFSHAYVENEGMEALSLALRNMKSLRTLYLDFSCCIRFNDKGFESLCLSFPYLSLLSSLNIWFKSCGNIGDKGMKALSLGLKGHKGLRDVYLQFLCCQNISDRGLESLAEGLKTLDADAEICWDFENCVKISDKGKDNFVKSVIGL